MIDANTVQAMLDSSAGYRLHVTETGVRIEFNVQNAEMRTLTGYRWVIYGEPAPTTAPEPLDTLMKWAIEREEVTL